MRMTVNPRKLSSGVALCAGLALCLAGSASAQPMFQSTFPGGGSNDAARGGVLLTSDGGTISVGESQSFTKGAYDVYVIKTNECGSLQWSTTYDFGGNDYGRKIRQTSDGGYIIVGTTYRATCCDEAVSIEAPDADIFLLKIDAKGGVQWAKTYGGVSHDEGTDVQIYPDGGYVVSGNTQSFGDGKINGYLMRADAGGNVIWGRSFGQRLTDFTIGAEVFNSCTVAAKGDILVAGVSYSFGGSYILAVRTDANGFASWATIYPSKGAGNARHIIETSDGTFVIAGSLVTSATGTRDGYLLRIDGAGTALFDQSFAEAYRKFDDELAEVRETFGGNLVFTGYMTDAPGGFGGRDLLLGEVDYKFNSTGWFSLHGGKLADEGYSIAFSPELSEKYGGIFVVANGVTRSFSRSKLADEDVYLVQALGGGKSGCNDTYAKVVDFRPGLQGKRVEYCHPLVRVQCVARVATVYHKEQNLLCTSCKFEQQMQENSDDPTLGEADHDIQSNGLHSDFMRVNFVTTSGQVETQDAR